MEVWSDKIGNIDNMHKEIILKSNHLALKSIFPIFPKFPKSTGPSVPNPVWYLSSLSRRLGMAAVATKDVYHSEPPRERPASAKPRPAEGA